MISHLAILGATGAVGREVCAILTQRSLPIERITLLASTRGAGTAIRVAGDTLTVAEVSEQVFEGVDYAIFSAGGPRSKKWAPIAVDSGTVVIDNSSAYRMHRDVPLVIPEINPGDLADHKRIIANPNCSTIIMNVAVWPLHCINPVKRVVVSTYQAASGAGAAAMAELTNQTADFLAGREINPQIFPHPVAFNLFSHNTPIDQGGYNSEERKMIDETRKIFHQPEMAITATCVRVPVLRAHSESINLTFDKPITANQVREILAAAPGISVVDDVEGGRFPMPVDASGQDAVLVGRVRQDASQTDGRGIELFVAGDQLRKGAALNAVQILEHLAGE